MLMPEALDLTAVLEDAQTIAVVGCSAKSSRTSNQISRYLQKAGYRIIPVNPNYDEVCGEKAYPDLPSVPHDITIDVVDIFRAPEHTADMVRSAIKRMEQTGGKPIIWTQIGVSSEEAKRLAEEAGLPYVENKCMKVEHMRRLD